jgi:hypothetical protein
MVRVTFRKLEKLDVKTLAAIVSVVVGGVVLGVFHEITGKQLPLEIFWYFPGLLLGYVFTALLEPGIV